MLQILIDDLKCQLYSALLKKQNKDLTQNELQLLYNLSVDDAIYQKTVESIGGAHERMSKV